MVTIVDIPCSVCGKLFDGKGENEHTLECHIQSTREMIESAMSNIEGAMSYLDYHTKEFKKLSIPNRQ